MDWQRYKTLCDRPDVMSRRMLEETACLVPAALRPPLRAAMEQTPLPKPSDHKGGEQTDMFEVVLHEFVDGILTAVEAAEARGDTTTQGRSLGGFVAAWRELKERGV
ncbi:MAG: hypothetical protein OXG82_16490 [Gammaproteobacteria bacterium]|nr:hypothetical protein [Gammaproteobacteria bacterium]